MNSRTLQFVKRTRKESKFSLGFLDTPTHVLTRSYMLLLFERTLGSCKKVFEFCPVLADVISRKDLIQERMRYPIIEYKEGFLLVAGGYDDHNDRSNSCEVYDIEEDTWTQIAPLQKKRANHTSFAFEDRYVYVYGGTTEDCNNTYLEKMDFGDRKKQKWTKIKISCKRRMRPNKYVISLQMSTDEALIFRLDNSSYATAIPHSAIFNSKTEKLKLAAPIPIEKELFHSTVSFKFIDEKETHYIACGNNDLGIFRGTKWVIIKDFFLIKDKQ